MKNLPPAPPKTILKMKSRTPLEEVGYMIFLFVYHTLCGNSLIFFNDFVNSEIMSRLDILFETHYRSNKLCRLCN